MAVRLLAVAGVDGPLEGPWKARSKALQGTETA